jgi:hypothetical protein
MLTGSSSQNQSMASFNTAQLQQQQQQQQQRQDILPFTNQMDQSSYHLSSNGNINMVRNFVARVG